MVHKRKKIFIERGLPAAELDGADPASILLDPANIMLPFDLLNLTDRRRKPVTTPAAQIASIRQMECNQKTIH